MQEFHGFIFSKLHLINSRSEGPTYYLQQFDYNEVPLAKKAMLWEKDSLLQEHLGEKVTVHGHISGNKLCYKKIESYHSAMEPGETQQENMLEVRLCPEVEVLSLDENPSGLSRSFKISLEVQWPYRSLWKGFCPTSQIYEFFLEHEGKTIWQWSMGKCYPPLITPVTIPGGSTYFYTEYCIIDTEVVKSNGIYTVRGLFIASGQEVEKDIQINISR